jgi:hypothetical protein
MISEPRMKTTLNGCSSSSLGITSAVKNAMAGLLVDAIAAAEVRLPVGEVNPSEI